MVAFGGVITSSDRPTVCKQNREKPVLRKKRSVFIGQTSLEHTLRIRFEQAINENNDAAPVATAGGRGMLLFETHVKRYAYEFHIPNVKLRVHSNINMYMNH